jgi:hypothetical protein
VITHVSSSLEIADLQQLLQWAGLMSTTAFKSGVWGEQTQRGVQGAYARLGWDHPQDGQWISAPAISAIAALASTRLASPDAGSTGGGGTHAGGGGTHAGGGGTYAGGGGTYAGGGANVT